MTERFSRPQDGTSATPGAAPPAGANPPPPPGAGSSGAQQPPDTRDAAKQEATGVANTARDDARQVGDTAKQEATQTAEVAKDRTRETAEEAKTQARDLYDQGRREITEQAGSQQHRLAGGLHDFSSEMGSMAENSSQQGVASECVRRAASYADQVGDWLDQREPADVLDEVTTYARRHPGTFLLGAAALGLLVGRTTRSLKDASSEESGEGRHAGTPADRSTQPGQGGEGRYAGGSTTEYAPYGTPTGDQSGVGGTTAGTATAGASSTPGSTTDPNRSGEVR
ncbi:hypothetical protein GCM10023169_32460 [Georgenia halophila]|uniref:F0F1-type ATP synthase membrane subunit b/b n=1 Tax=Georgenia halophila TaxID=620889 RepID=A0ABP8LK34_9MICO